MRASLGLLWTPKEECRADPSAVGLFQLAIPFFLESLLRSTVGLVNVAFLSHVSDNAVNAVSVANQYIQVCQTLATAVATGTMVCLNQAIGMKNWTKVNCLATIAFSANLMLRIGFGLIFLLFSDKLLGLMQLASESITFARSYMQISGGCMAFQCMEIISENIVRSIGHTRAPFAINIVVNTINIFLCYLVIFQPIPIAIDPVTGIAFSSVISRIVGSLIAFQVVKQTQIKISAHYLKPFPWIQLKLALSIGIPSGFNNLAYSLSQLMTTSIITLAGEMMVTAKVYVSNLVQYIALVGMAFAHASTIMVGYRVGAGKFDEAKQICKLVLKIVLLSNAFFSLLLILFRVPLLHLFTQSAEIIQLATGILLIDFVVELGRAMNNSLSGVLQATGDVKYQFVVNQASGWVVAVGGAYVLGILLKGNLYGIWVAFALDELTRGFILLNRWHKDKWLANAVAKLSSIRGT